MTVLMIWLLVLTGLGLWIWGIGSAIWLVIGLMTNFNLFWVKFVGLSKFFFIPLILFVSVSVITKMG